MNISAVPKIVADSEDSIIYILSITDSIFHNILNTLYTEHECGTKNCADSKDTTIYTLSITDSIFHNILNTLYNEHQCGTKNCS